MADKVSQSKLDSAAKEMMDSIQGAQVLPVAADVREPLQLEHAVSACLNRFNGIDIVVCGAAGNFMCHSTDLSYRAFKTVIDIDLIGTWNTIKACLPSLQKSGDACIIAVSATLHYGASVLQLHPSAAKAGVDSIIRTLAVELGPQGIRSNIIAPGPIADTEGMARLSAPSLQDAIIQSVPLRDMGVVGDIEHAALYLASDAGRYVNGATIVVDGGQWMQRDRGEREASFKQFRSEFKTGKESKL